MKNRISKTLGICLTVGLVLGLIGAVFAAPVAADQMKWTKVTTPDMGDMVILPSSDILDYDIGGDGDIIYAVLEVNEGCAFPSRATLGNFALVKWDDGGVTWSDITAKVTPAANLPAGGLSRLTHVAVAPDDADSVLAKMKQNKYGAGAVIIGEAVAGHPGRVVMKTSLGASRIVDMPVGELLPRIC